MTKGLNTNVLYGAIAGAILGDIIPTPGDALAFLMQRKLRDEWTKGNLSAKEYWAKQALYYYTFNAAWWGLVLLVVSQIKGDAKDKLKVALGMAGAGIVLGVILKNIRKDEKENLAVRNGVANSLLDSYENSHGLHDKNTKQTIKK
jgi:hypothetical protein